MVLLIIDTQAAIVTPELHDFDRFVDSVQQLIAAARRHGMEVIFIRHDDGYPPLMPGNPGFEIDERFRPAEGERIFDKQVNSAFHSTGLLEYLREKGEDTVIVAGLQTDYCIDATVKAGFEHGLRVIVPAHANSTFSNEFMSAEASYHYHNDFMWKGRYAQCLPLEEVLAMLHSSKEAP